MPGPQFRRRTARPVNQKPVIEDAKKPVFVTPQKESKAFDEVLFKPTVWLRIGDSIPKQTADLRTVGLTARQARTLAIRLLTCADEIDE